MSASHAFFTTPTSLLRYKEAGNRPLMRPFLAGGSLIRSSWHELFVRSPVRIDKRSVITGFTYTPVMEWQDCRAKVEVEVPCSVAYDLYSDREAVPRWMPNISSVKVIKDKPDFSRWTFSYDYLGRAYTFSWVAHNLKPIRNQKIHWRSVDGVPNRGAVRFFPRGSSSCVVELTVSYEIPQVLSPLGAALGPFMDGLLQRCLDQFAVHATGYKANCSRV